MPLNSKLNTSNVVTSQTLFVVSFQAALSQSKFANTRGGRCCSTRVTRVGSRQPSSRWNCGTVAATLSDKGLRRLAVVGPDLKGSSREGLKRVSAGADISHFSLQ